MCEKKKERERERERESKLGKKEKKRKEKRASVFYLNKINFRTSTARDLIPNRDLAAILRMPIRDLKQQ